MGPLGGFVWAKDPGPALRAHALCFRSRKARVTWGRPQKVPVRPRWGLPGRRAGGRASQRPAAWARPLHAERCGCARCARSPPLQAGSLDPSPGPHPAKTRQHESDQLDTDLCLEQLERDGDRVELVDELEHVALPLAPFLESPTERAPAPKNERRRSKMCAGALSAVVTALTITSASVLITGAVLISASSWTLRRWSDGEREARSRRVSRKRPRASGREMRRAAPRVAVGAPSGGGRGL